MAGNLFMRDDTFFGVCQGIGDDFGFSPNWLRVVFGVTLLVNPPVVLAVYFGLGLVVAAVRLIVREPSAAATGTKPAAPAPTEAAPAAAAEAAPAEVEAISEPELAAAA